MSTIFNAVGFRVQVEKMIATGRIDMVVETQNITYVMELKLSNNGGLSAAKKQIQENHYLEPFKVDKRQVTGLAIELDEQGKVLSTGKELKVEMTTWRHRGAELKKRMTKEDVVDNRLGGRRRKISDVRQMSCTFLAR